MLSDCRRALRQFHRDLNHEVMLIACRPSEVGIDVVVESATKYLNGHADLAAGAVAGSSEFLKKARMPPCTCTWLYCAFFLQCLSSSTGPRP